MNKAHNIYIHVPFCVQKCKYCAFFSRACGTPNWDEYADSIIGEKIMDSIRKNFEVNTNAEITIESNPGTIDENKLGEFCAAGVNRLSIGVQSFDDDKLKFLGRIHNANDARKLIDAAIKRGIRVSADFIYGLPGDTAKDVIDICNEINKIGLTHCSLYELTIEPDTAFGKMELAMPDNDTMAEMYIAIENTLNIPRYEVSNYAAAGHECRHNQNVWDGEPYIGIGIGAAGRVFMDNVWYEELGGGKMFQPMSDDARAIERVITGMRTMRGVRMDSATKKILNLEFAKSHTDMVMFSGDRLHATKSGILVLDDLIEKLVK